MRVLSLVLLYLLQASSIPACSHDHILSPCEKYNLAYAVFVGTVTEVSDFHGGQPYQAKMQVEKIYKGWGLVSCVTMLHTCHATVTAAYVRLVGG